MARIDMETQEELYFEHHIFCCLNERKPGHKRGSCIESGGQKLFNYLKSRIKELGYKGQIRVNKSGCLDRCELGPVIVIYPEAVWYSYHSFEDIEEIIQSHIQEGKVVERLKLDPQQTEPRNADQKG